MSFMANTSLADTVRNPESRLGRAVLLFEERGHEVEAIGGGVYLVPSSDGTTYYRVDYRNETCNCPDADFHPDENCKHVLMLGISLAKRRAKKVLPCAACGSRFLRKALVEAFEDTATVSAGERVCGPCGRAHGVL
jgi:hypothetical protein